MDAAGSGVGIAQASRTLSISITHRFFVESASKYTSNILVLTVVSLGGSPSPHGDDGTR